MKLKFVANKVTSEINTEEEYYMIGFSDNEDDPDQYVFLQKSITFDEQDIDLGMDTYYFEYSDQSNSGYGVCESVKIEEGKVIFNLKEKAIDDIEALEITFTKEALVTDWNEFLNIIHKILEDIKIY